MRANNASYSGRSGSPDGGKVRGAGGKEGQDEAAIQDAWATARQDAKEKSADVVLGKLDDIEAEKERASE